MKIYDLPEERQSIVGSNTLEWACGWFAETFPMAGIEINNGIPTTVVIEMDPS